MSKLPKCDICGKSFDVEKKPGALLFSPPKTVKHASLVLKSHVCRDCYKEIKKLKKRKAKKDDAGRRS